MTPEQCKYLTTEVLGECFHDYAGIEKFSGELADILPMKLFGELLKCKECGLEVVGDHSTFRTFDNWTDFGALWETMSKLTRLKFLEWFVGTTAMTFELLHPADRCELIYNFFNEQSLERE